MPSSGRRDAILFDEAANVYQHYKTNTMNQYGQFLPTFIKQYANLYQLYEKNTPICTNFIQQIRQVNIIIIIRRQYLVMGSAARFYNTERPLDTCYCEDEVATNLPRSLYPAP